MPKQKSVAVFCCYAHEDEELLDKLKRHLSPLQHQELITIWHDRNISAGAIWEEEIKRHLNGAQIILLLISPDFMSSKYCYGIEMQHALARHQSGEAIVIPVILRHTYWQEGPLGDLQALPTDGRPVASQAWSQDEAFYTVVLGIRKAIEAHLTNEEQRRRAEEAEWRQAEEARQARLVEEEHLRQAAEAEQERLAEEERIRNAKEEEHIRRDEEERRLLAEGSAPRPFVSSPNQNDGNVASVPFFPDPPAKEARLAEEARLVEETRRAEKAEQARVAEEARRVEEARQVHLAEEAERVRKLEEEKQQSIEVDTAQTILVSQLFQPVDATPRSQNHVSALPAVFGCLVYFAMAGSLIVTVAFIAGYFIYTRFGPGSSTGSIVVGVIVGVILFSLLIARLRTMFGRGETILRMP